MADHKRLLLTILVIGGIFCLSNANHFPPDPEPKPIEIEAVQPNTLGKLTERQLDLVQESMSYALHSVTGIPGNQAREIVRLASQETSRYQDIDCLLVLGLIVAESMGNDRATSPVGARGLMQIMPATGQGIAASFHEKWEGTRSLYETERNIRYGVWYLSHLQEQFPNNEQAMVAAYNWGPPNIQERIVKGFALPKVYPGRVWRARERIREEMYEFHKEQYWRSLDLSRDLPYFQDHPTKPSDRSRYTRLPIHDGESQLLRQGSGVQQMSQILLGGDRQLPGR